MSDLCERLLVFEGSDELGNGDFSVCREAAAHITRLTSDLAEARIEILRLVDALVYAHDAGFEWPVDPLPFGSIAHNLLIERGNDPDRIEARATLEALRNGGSNDA